MKTITKNKLQKLLSEVNHSTFFSFTALTTVKTPVDAPVIKKLSRVNVCVGDYGNAVRNRQQKEGNEPTFKTHPRKWGKRVSIALIEHETKNGDLKHYISAQVLKAKTPIYLMEHAPLRKGGKTRLMGVTKDQIAQWLPSYRSAAEAQGLEKEVVHRDFSLDNITCLSAGGEVYKVVG
jgi:hypothetical protein